MIQQPSYVRRLLGLAMRMGTYKNKAPLLHIHRRNGASVALKIVLAMLVTSLQRVHAGFLNFIYIYHSYVDCQLLKRVKP
jgi:hypothetical protein